VPGFQGIVTASETWTMSPGGRDMTEDKHDKRRKQAQRRQGITEVSPWQEIRGLRTYYGCSCGRLHGVRGRKSMCETTLAPSTC